MPRVLTRNGRVVVKGGRVALDAPGCTPCCAGTPQRCPSPCGREFEACVDEYTFSYTTATTITAAQQIPAGSCDNFGPSYTSTYNTSDTENMEVGPWRVPWSGDLGFVGVCDVRGLLPVRNIVSNQTTGFRCNGVSVSDSSFQEEVFCRPFWQCCPPDSGGLHANAWTYSDNNGSVLTICGAYPSTTLRTGLTPFADLPASFLTTDGTQTTSVPFIFNCSPGGPRQLGVTVTTWTVTRSWRSGVGDNSFEAVVVKTVTGPHFDSDALCLGTKTVTETGRSLLRFRIVPRILCDGSPRAGCPSPLPTDCTGQIEYIIGDACPGQINPPRVLFYAQAVNGCDTVNVGGFCYTVSKNGRRGFNPRPTDVISDMVITGLNRSCCECLPGCGATPIVRGACWYSGIRKAEPDGRWLLEPAIPPPNACCCRPDDIITIIEMSVDETTQGPVRRWRLKFGPISFPRNWNGAGSQPGLDPAGHVVSALTDANGNPWPGTPQFDHGGIGYTGMGCEWQGMGSAFPLGTPQNGSISDPLLTNGLPCGNESDGTLNNWALTRRSVSVNCQLFTFSADYTGPGGATATQRLQVRVQPNPANTNCTGGCPPPASGGTPPRPIEPVGGIGDILGIDFPPP